MPDPVSAIVAYLKSDPDIAELVSARVFGGPLPAREAVSMPRNAITVKPSGGGTIGSSFMNVHDVRLDVISYSTSLLGAWNLYQAVHTALKFNLKRSIHAGTLLYWGKESAAGSIGYDPETDWPTVLSSWQVLAGEESP